MESYGTAKMQKYREKKNDLIAGMNECQVSFEKGDYSGANAALEKFEEPSSPLEKFQYHLLKIKIALRIGNPPEIEMHLNSAWEMLKQPFEFGDYFNDLGDLYFELRQYPKALNCYSKALEPESTNAYSLYKIGLLAKEIGSPEEADKYLINAAEIFKVWLEIKEPIFIDYYGANISFYCDCLLKLEKTEDVEKFLQAERKRLKYSQNDYSYWFSFAFGNLYQVTGRISEAVKELEYVIHSENATAQQKGIACKKIAAMLGKNNEVNRAADYERKAIQFDPIFDKNRFYSSAVQPCSDNPTENDRLGRKTFASVVAEIIRRMWKENADAQGTSLNSVPRAFIFGIHGSWGSGKTSVLKMIENELKNSNSSNPENHLKWIVINFNAWQNHRQEVAWWALISELVKSSIKQSSGIGKLKLNWLWWRWQISINLLPYLAIVAGVVFFTIFIINKISNFKETIEIVSGLGTLCSLSFFFIRNLIAGSESAAKKFIQSKDDPLAPAIKLFEKVTSVVRQPIVIIIDDIDRCNSEYVVQLLEGIQTMFRKPNIAYIISGDKEWISNSFEQYYKDFLGKIEHPGRPFGYYFLDKIFQVSIDIPSLTPVIKQTYWAGIIGTSDIVQQTTMNEIIKPDYIEPAVHNIRKNLIEIPLDTYKSIEILSREKAAKQITSFEEMSHQYHILTPYAVYLDSNPRSMKRMVNTWAVRKAAYLLRDGTQPVSNEVLALWIIIEFRWPNFAKLLLKQPELIKYLLSDPKEDMVKTGFSKEINEMRSVSEFIDIFKKCNGTINENQVRILAE